MTTPIYNHILALPWAAQDNTAAQLGYGTQSPIDLGLPRTHTLYRQPQTWMMRWSFALTYKGDTALAERVEYIEDDAPRTTDAWRLCLPLNTEMFHSANASGSDWNATFDFVFSFQAASARDIAGSKADLENVWPKIRAAVTVSVGEPVSGTDSWVGAFRTDDADLAEGIYARLKYPRGGTVELRLGGSFDSGTPHPENTPPSMSGDLFISWVPWVFERRPIPVTPGL